MPKIKKVESDLVEKNTAVIRPLLDKTDIEKQNDKNKQPIDGTPFEEAIKLTGYGRFNHWLLTVSGVGAMGGIMEMIVMSYLISAAQCDLNMTDNDKGLLGAITYIGIFCSGHFWGIIADTKGRKKVMQITLLCDAFVGILSCLSPNYVTLVVFRFINGFCVSAPASLSYAYLGEFNTPENRNRNLILIGLFTGSTALTLPAIAWAILPQTWEIDGPWGPLRSWRLLNVLAALPSLLSGLCFFTLPESPKFLLAAGESEKSLDILKKMYASNSRNSPDTYPVKSLLSETTASHAGQKKTAAVILNIVWNQTAPLFKSQFLLHTLLVCFIQFGNIASASGLLMWLPELFNLQAKYSDSHPGEYVTFCKAAQYQNLTSIINNLEEEVPVVGCSNEIKQQVFINALILGTVNMFLPLLGGLVVNVLGKKNLLILSMILSGFAGIAFNFVPSYTGTLVLASIIVPVTGMCISHISSIVVDLFPTNIRAMAVSLSLMCGRLGSMSGNFIFGSLLRTQCEVAFYFFGGLLLLNGAFSFLLPKRGKYAS